VGNELYPSSLFKIFFIFIVRDANFHFSNSCFFFFWVLFQSFHQQVHIVLSINGIHILVDVIIVDLVWTNLILFHISILQDDYDNGDLSKRRILSQSIFDGYIFFYCHKSFWLFTSIIKQFFHRCTNMVWLAISTNGPPFIVLYVIYRQKVSNSFTKSSSHLYFEMCHQCKLELF
jgi:hypothetical protein